MSVHAVLQQFHEVAANPKKQLDHYIAAEEKVVLTAPVYTPEELIHAMGLVPMGAWGADIALDRSKEYFPAFICSVMQSILEIGMRGDYRGACAIVIPSLCDSLKCLGQNWKYAVPDIPFIPMTYPQNRRCEGGREFVKAGYERVIDELEKRTGKTFSEEALSESIRIYNHHNTLMRQVDERLSGNPEITAVQRSDIFKSAWFMKKEEHSALLERLLAALQEEKCSSGKVRIMTSGILLDNPALLNILDEQGYQIVADDVAAESRQYRVDTREDLPPLEGLCDKFTRMDHCSVLYDAEKKRVDLIMEMAKKREAEGVLIAVTKFCDPEEFDYPLIKKACEAAGLPHIMIEIDRQMEDFGQARTQLEAFREMS